MSGSAERNYYERSVPKKIVKLFAFTTCILPSPIGRPHHPKILIRDLIPVASTTRPMKTVPACKNSQIKNPDLSDVRPKQRRGRNKEKEHVETWAKWNDLRVGENNMLLRT